MKRKKIVHKTAANARELQDKMNELKLTKERIVQIVFNGSSYVVFYESY